jgi:predicted DNA-binding transcriptional regulator AlpA
MNSEIKSNADMLFAKFNSLVLTRGQVAEALGISLSQVDKLLHQGFGLPEYRRLGRKRGRIVFPVTSVAKFLSSTQQGGYFEE